MAHAASLRGWAWDLIPLLSATLGAVAAALAAEYLWGLWFSYDPVVFFPWALLRRALPAGLAAGALGVAGRRRVAVSVPGWAWAAADLSLGALAGLLVRTLAR